MRLFLAFSLLRLFISIFNFLYTEFFSFCIIAATSLGTDGELRRDSLCKREIFSTNSPSRGDIFLGAGVTKERSVLREGH